MQQLSTPTSPKIYSTQYRQLLGVDYQKDVTDVDRRRSPDMINMISDLGGNPIKRDGYRIVAPRYDSMLQVAGGDIFGVRQDGSTDEIQITKLKYENEVLNELSTDSSTALIGTVQGAFTYGSKIYALGKFGVASYDTYSKKTELVGLKDAVAFDEEQSAKDNAVLPNIISLNPDGSGGTTQYGKNLLSPFMRFEYLSNGEATEYVIPNYQYIQEPIVEVQSAEGEWQKKTKGADYTITEVSVTAYLNLCGDTIINAPTQKKICKNKITFTTAPTAPPIAGQDNVRITFAPFYTDKVMFNEQEVQRGFYNKTAIDLLQVDAYIFFNNRLFIAEGNRIYYSAVNNPFHIADNDYFEVDNDVTCFTTTSSYLAVLTKDTGKNTIYLASPLSSSSVTSLMGNSYDTYYTVKPSNAGVGAVAKHCIDTVNDEPLFLTHTGVFGIQSNYLSEKYAVNRSTRINRRLCKEEGLENAVGKSHNGYFYVAINGNMYVLDSRHKESDKAGNKPYEAYYFNNLPIIKEMYVLENRMFFTDEEHTYTWNDDLGDFERYYDRATRNSDGVWHSNEPVYAMWCSVHDDDGAPQKLKSLQKRGSMVTVVPFAHSTFHLTIIKDGDSKFYLGQFQADRLMFSGIDFSKFTFSTNVVASDVFLKKKIKKYKRLQVILESKDAEPFGITNVVKSYIVNTFAKK